MSNKYNFNLELPEIFKSKQYDFIFSGFEDYKNNLLYRFDIFDIQNNINWEFQSSDAPEKLVLWGYKDGWTDEKLVIPVNSLSQPIEKLEVEKIDKNKLDIFNNKVTCVFIDEYKDEYITKIISDYKKIGIKNILHINSKNFNIPEISSIKKYSEFIIKELYKYIDTDYCLINQWDGFILNFNSFDEIFFNYDYIGADWWWKENTLVGNGGFSLRSKNFLNVCSKIFNNSDIDKDEDEFFEENISLLVQRGIKFAPIEIKNKFSIENDLYNNQFGFHNYISQNLPNKCKQFYKNKFYHSGDLGDIIYSLPTIKALGGGLLVLSSDYDKMDVRNKLSLDTINELKSILNLQEYIIDTRAAHKKPADIDFDLNDMRQPFIDWGAGKFNEEEVQILRNKSLTHHYFDLYNLNHYNECNEWLYTDITKIYNEYPIVINRTERYNNINFPWQEIVDTYFNKIIFVGLPNEYNRFKNSYGKVKYIESKTLLDLFQIISGCKIFIGNQSFPYSLAEGLKKNCVQETDTWVGNCQYFRHNSYIIKDGKEYSFEKIDKFINKYI